MSILLISLAILSVGAGAFLFSAAWRSRRQKASVESLHLVGCRASVVEPLNMEGAVLVRGELWRARPSGDARVECGENNVRVVGARGHLLEVEPV